MILALFVIEAWAKQGCTTKLCQESASCHGGCILSKHDLPSADDVADHHWCVHVFVLHLPPISPTTLELERSFAQRVGKAERQYTLLITTDFVYIVSITFENPNRFRCKIYSWGKALMWTGAHRIPPHEASRSPSWLKPSNVQFTAASMSNILLGWHSMCSIRVFLVLLILAGQFLAFSAFTFTCCVRSNNEWAHFIANRNSWVRSWSFG